MISAILTLIAALSWQSRPVNHQNAEVSHVMCEQIRKDSESLQQKSPEATDVLLSMCDYIRELEARGSCRASSQH